MVTRVGVSETAASFAETFGVAGAGDAGSSGGGSEGDGGRDVGGPPQTPPDQLVWCGSGALALFWEVRLWRRKQQPAFCLLVKVVRLACRCGWGAWGCTAELSPRLNEWTHVFQPYPLPTYLNPPHASNPALPPQGTGLLLITLAAEWRWWECDASAALVAEVDGCRILTQQGHFLLRRVPDVLTSVLEIGSTSPGGCLWNGWGRDRCMRHAVPCAVLRSASGVRKKVWAGRYVGVLLCMPSGSWTLNIMALDFWSRQLQCVDRACVVAGALLYDARRLFDAQDARATGELLEILKAGDLPAAVTTCLRAAAAELDPHKQAALMKVS